MAIKTSGEIKFQDIINEFGGTGEAPLSDYYRGGLYVPNTNSNSNIGTQGNPISLGQFYGARKEIIMTYTMYGGGGAGGNGIADRTGSGTNDPGSETYLITKAAWDAAAENPANSAKLVRASGGAGGAHANQSSITGAAGASSDFGAGGAGGSPNQAGANPTWGHWGAGGGGGGGDDGSTSYLNLYGSDAAGAAGAGASASAVTSGTYSLDVEVDYVLVIGEGGDPSAVYNYKGGRGAPGYVEFTTSIEGSGKKYIGVPSGDGTSNNHYITPNAYILRITRAGQILWYRITEAQPTIFALPINSSWGTSGANEVDIFTNIEYGFRLQGNGTTSKIEVGVNFLFNYPTNIADWLPDTDQGSGAGANYEARVTKVSGDDTTFLYNGSAGVLGQWYTLNQNFDVKLVGSGRTADAGVVNLKIREVGGSINHVDQNITINLNTIPGG